MVMQMHFFLVLYDFMWFRYFEKGPDEDGVETLTMNQVFLIEGALYNLAIFGQGDHLEEMEKMKKVGDSVVLK